MKKVFLGGTCNDSTWRNVMMNYLQQGAVDYFNPVVDDWNQQAQENEFKERESCDFCLYTITAKKIGDYSIAEVVDDSNKRPEKTVFVILREDDGQRFSDLKWKSLKMVAKMVQANGGQVFEDLKLAADYMTKK